MPILEVTDLKTHFHTRHGVVRAVDGVSFSLERGETLGIVGESGSGKSVTCYSLLGLVTPPGRVVAGQAVFDGTDLLNMSNRDLRSVRGRRIAMVFQDPMTSLNPYLRIERQIGEVARMQGITGRDEVRRRSIEALRQVGIQDPEARIRDYPHQLSGGMRQRVMIAMALLSDPDILIADEPTTALDVTIQAEILQLINTLRQRLGTAVLLITHDLGVVAAECDRVMVMYAGRIMEAGDVDDIFYDAKHPYTKALRESIPDLRESRDLLKVIPGEPPDLTDVPAGCPFAPRCEHCDAVCSEPIELCAVTERHFTACTRVKRGDL